MNWSTFLGAALALAVVTPAALSQGSVKGKVVWTPGIPVPKNEEIDPKLGDCKKGGKIFKDAVLVDAKTKGIKNVVFWLVPAKDPLGTIPTPAALKGKIIDLDQPCCEFAPRHVVVLEGQKLRVKNSAGFAHNTKMDGGVDGPNFNLLVPAKGELKPVDVKPRPVPAIPFSCSIHGWMKGYVHALPSPYYALTAADGTFEIKGVPAGDYRLVGWHEEIGWIFFDNKMEKRNVPVSVKDGKATEVKPLERDS